MSDACQQEKVEMFRFEQSMLETIRTERRGSWEISPMDRIFKELVMSSISCRVLCGINFFIRSFALDCQRKCPVR